MTTEETRELADRFVKAYLAGDAEAIGALLAKDIIHIPPPSLAEGPHEGRDAAAAALAEPTGRGALKAGTVRREVTLAIADGDGALVKVGVTAKTVNHLDYRNEIVLITAARDGAIVRVDEFGDTLNDYDCSIIEEVPEWQP